MLFHIDPLRLWVHKVLPVVYDDSLSYYEVLAKVTKKLNEVIDLTEEQNQYIEEFSTNLTNAINHWEDGMEQEWSSYKSGLNNEWGAFQRNTEQYIENWKNMAESDIEDAIAAGINQFVGYFSGLTQTAVDAAERAMEAAETAAEDAVDAIMPTLESQFDARYAWKTAVGSPLVATTAAGMTDTTKVYVYVGSETGYVNGDWYYYDGTAWQDGGVYNSAAVVTDTTLSEAGVPADAKAAGDKIADLKSALNLTPEDGTIIFDPSNVTTRGYYKKADGTLSTDSNWRRSNKITVIVGDWYHIHSIGHPSVASVAFFASDNSFIDAISADTQDGWVTTDFSIPSNCASLAVSWYNPTGITGGENQKLVKISPVVSTHEKYYTQTERINARKNINAISTTAAYFEKIGRIHYMQYDGEYLFNNMPFNKGYIKATDGTVLTTDQHWYYSDYFKIDQNANISCNLWGHTSVASIAFYNSNKEFISAISASSNDGMYTSDAVTIPSNAEFLRYTMYVKSINNISVNRDSQFIKFYTVPNLSYIPEISNKKIAFLGDSFTSQAIYVNDVINRINCIAYNYGVSGTGYMAYNNNDNFLSRIASMDNSVDYIFIFGGVNDFGPNKNNETRNFHVGVQTDTINDDTMYGKVKATFEAIQTKYPSKRIAVATPCKMASSALALANNYTFGRDTNSYGDTLSDFVNAIIYCAKEYSIPILDLYHESGWNDITIPTMTNDGLHPNNVGAKIIGNKIARFLMQI